LNESLITYGNLRRFYFLSYSDSLKYTHNQALGEFYIFHYFLILIINPKLYRQSVFQELLLSLCSESNSQ